MKILFIIMISSILFSAEIKSLTIVDEDDKHELTDKDCITAFIKLITTKIPYKDPGLPPIGGGDIKILQGKRLLCEVNIGLEYYSSGGKKFAIPKELFPQIKLSVDGPEKPWSMGLMESIDGKRESRKIETRDIATQKTISLALSKYLGENDKGKDSDQITNSPRYIFSNYPGNELIEYDVNGRYIYNGKSIIKLPDADHEALLATFQGIDKNASVKKRN